MKKKHKRVSEDAYNFCTKRKFKICIYLEGMLNLMKMLKRLLYTKVEIQQNAIINYYYILKSGLGS